MAVQFANALYAVWLRISYIVQAALRSVGAAGGGWALLAVLRAIGFLVKPTRQPGHESRWWCFHSFHATVGTRGIMPLGEASSSLR